MIRSMNYSIEKSFQVENSSENEETYFLKKIVASDNQGCRGSGDSHSHPMGMGMGMKFSLVGIPIEITMGIPIEIPMGIPVTDFIGFTFTTQSDDPS